MTFKRKPRKEKIEAHPQLWSVVLFGDKWQGLDSYWATKAEADREAKTLGTKAFVLPPKNAWAGRT